MLCHDKEYQDALTFNFQQAWRSSTVAYNARLGSHAPFRDKAFASMCRLAEESVR